MTELGSSLGGIPRLEISEERRRQLESSSDDLVEKALKMHDEFHAGKKHDKSSKQWKLVKRKKSLNLYRERGKSASNLSRNYLCSGVMPGTVEDMVSGLYSDDTESMRTSMGITTDKFLDARVLHVFERNPATNSVVFSGIKWLAFKTPATIHDRDMLVFNRMGRIVDQRGRYFIYNVMDSVDLDAFPANRRYHVERGSVSMCYLFRQVQEEWVGCFIMGGCNMGGTLPRSMSELITAEHVLSVGNVLLVARAKAYSARMADSSDRIASTSSLCDICMKKPNVLSGSLKLCMGCRRNTCRKCRDLCTVFRLELRSHKAGKELFCSQCVSEVTRPTVSNFYMCSLNESTNNQSSTSVSAATSGFQHSSSSLSSSSRSQDLSDVWIPELPEDLDGLANFVERASLASTKDVQWNQEELDYFSDVLRESGHLKPPPFTDSNTTSSSHSTNSHARRTPSYNSSHPSSSMPTPDQGKPDRHVSRSSAADGNDKFFSVDELD